MNSWMVGSEVWSPGRLVAGTDGEHGRRAASVAETAAAVGDEAERSREASLH